MVPTRDLAIQKALDNRWKEASQINELLLKDNPEDLDTLNRLAFSLLKLGKFNNARTTYKKVIALDKTNPIALKNLKKLESIAKHKGGSAFIYQPNGIRFDDLFIEEAGKTKIVDLKNITDRLTLSLLQPGDTVYLIIKRSKIFVQTTDKKFVGMLPDNINTRLIPFMRGGNEYHAYIKSIDDKSVAIFIKENKKAKRFANQPSFNLISMPILKKK